MRTWLDLYNIVGYYVSSPISISSNFDYYIPTINLVYNSNDGEVNFLIRVSTDNGFSWSDWTNVNNRSHKELFDGYGIKHNYTMLQFKVEMNMNDYSGTPPEFISLSMNLDGGYKITNTGDVECKPEIWIKKINGFGDVELTNERTRDTLKFTGINNGETVYVDCYNKDIMSDLPLTYRIDNHNRVFPKLDVGDNVITGKGHFELVIRTEFKVMQ